MDAAAKKYVAKQEVLDYVVTSKPAISPAAMFLPSAGMTASGNPIANPIAFRGNIADVIDTMRHGVSAHIVAGVAARLDMSQDKLFESLRLPKSTIKGRIGKNQALSAVEQDRLYRAERVWLRAVAVLEDDIAACAWIKRPNRALGGEAPLTLLDTEAGYELVLDTLGQIEYGVLS